MDAFSLVARLTLDKDDYDKGLKDAESTGSSFGSKVASGFQVAGKAVSAVLGTTTAVIGATTAVGTALVSSAGDVASYGDNIDKASQKLGISAEAYQEWDAILQHSGTSISTLKGSFKTLNKAIENLGSSSGEAVVDQEKLADAQTKYENSLLNIEKAQLDYNSAVEKYGEGSTEAQKKLIALETAQNNSELAQQKLAKAMEGSTPKLSDAGAALQSLGISAVDANGNLRDQEEVFAEVMTALQGMENETERTRLATVLLGRGGQELGALLNTSAEDTEAMRQRVHELGGVMSDEAVKASAAYQDSLQDMTTALDGIKRGMISDFLPSITNVMDGIGNLLSGDAETGLGQIKDGASMFLSTLSDMVPEVLEIGTQLIATLGEAIIDNLPTIFEAGVNALLTLAEGIGDALPELIPAAIDVILTLTNSLLDNVDKLVDAALKLMGGLIKGIVNALPKIVEAIGKVIAKLVETIAKNLPKIYQKGVELLGELIAGIVDFVPKLLLAIGSLIKDMLTSFTQTDWQQVGKNVIDGIVQGIKNFGSTIKTAAQNAMTSAIDGVKKLFGISSPSKVFRDEVGKWIPEGIAVGIEANTDSVKSALSDLSDMTKESFDTNLNGGSGAILGDTVTINVYGAEGQNVRELAQQVSEIISDKTARRRAVYA